ncbi:MAG: hypothetical protein ILM98_02765 [Kiritimatiellae bacterium]|nr:hypothetical protein [Kiritimatiellia bacterium]
MKQAFSLVLAAAIAACLAIPAQAAAPVSATPVWGTALSLGAPIETFFRLGAYSPAWKFRGAAGGAHIEGDPSGARAFTIDMSGAGGENIAAGAARLDGRATFSLTDDGALDCAWQVVPDRDAELNEIMLEARLSLGSVAGGFRADDRIVGIPSSVPDKPHLFRGPVSCVELLGADGAPWLSIEFPDKASILVQDNRPWGNSIATLRLFLAQGPVERGKTYSIRALFRVPGHEIALDDTGATTIEAGPDWIPVAITPHGEDWIEPGSALDLSPTMPRHEPAGAFGRVVSVGEHFELEGRPGEEIRFCGVNIVHGANTPSTPEDAERFAANLARMGFNSVRIHHHERPLIAKGDPAALTIDPVAQDRFDALCAACIRHGLYITTDLFVSRAPIKWRGVGIDRDGTMDKDDYKRLVAFHEGAYSNLVAWTRQFLCHVNPYTGRSLAEEPALATLAIVNEGNLGNWGRDAIIQTPGVADAWQAWLAENGKLKMENGKLDAWSVSTNSQFSIFNSQFLPADLYEANGDGKELSNLFALFLAESEVRFFNRMAALVRDELGCRAPLSSISSWYNPESYSLARAVFDYDDDHGYVDHPFFLGKQWRLPSTHSGANPLLGGDAVPGFAWRRLFGKPLCVTEWNWAAPGEFRSASGLIMGAIAARQGWAGLWRFAWSHDRGGVDAPGSVRMRYFDLHADPTQCASERATICLFGRGDIPPLPADCASPIELDEAALRRGERAAKRISPPKGAVSGWERRIGVRLSSSSPDCPSSSPSQPGCEKPPSPVTLLPSIGGILIDTPRTAGGFAPSGTHAAGPLAFTILAPAAPAAVWASSVDGKPLAESSRILLSHVTDSKNTGARFDDQACRVWIDYGTLPALMRNGAVRIELRLSANEGCTFGANEVCGAAANEGCADANDSSLPPDAAHSLPLKEWPSIGGKPVARVFRLSPSGHRIAEVPCSWEPSGGSRAPGESILRFTARTDYDPSAATLYYEITR